MKKSQALLAEQNQQVMFDPETFFQLVDLVEETELELAATTTSIDEMEAEPVGAKDIAQRLGIPAQTVATWRQRGVFPPPRWTVAGEAVWQWPTVLAWYEARKAKKSSSHCQRTLTG